MMGFVPKIILAPEMLPLRAMLPADAVFFRNA
jgi:hypothetical protein